MQCLTDWLGETLPASESGSPVKCNLGWMCQCVSWCGTQSDIEIALFADVNRATDKTWTVALGCLWKGSLAMPGLLSLSFWCALDFQDEGRVIIFILYRLAGFIFTVYRICVFVFLSYPKQKIILRSVRSYFKWTCPLFVQQRYVLMHRIFIRLNQETVLWLMTEYCNSVTNHVKKTNIMSCQSMWIQRTSCLLMIT